MASHKRWDGGAPGHTSKLLQEPPILIDAVGKGWRAQGWQERETKAVSLAEARARWAATQAKPEKVVPKSELQPREDKVVVIDGKEFIVAWDGA